MDIRLFFISLTTDEKKELFKELKFWFEKGETLKEFYSGLLVNEIAMSVRMDNILRRIITEYEDYANCPVSEILEDKGLAYPCLMKVRGFGQTLLSEFKLLRVEANESKYGDKRNDIPEEHAQKPEKTDFQNNKVLSFEQGCEYLGLKKSYVYKMTASGILPFSKPNGKKIFFDREKLEAWMLGNASKSHTERQIEAATYETTRKKK